MLAAGSVGGDHLCLLAYGSIVGSEVSVTRATFAASVFLGAMVVDHRASPLNTLALAAACLTAVAPLLERFSDSLGSDWARDERRERRGEVRRERVVDTAIECLQRFSPAECRNCFRHCGYSIATQS